MPCPKTVTRLVGALSVVAGLLSAGPAGAQVRWDAGAQAGVSRRFTTGASAGVPQPGFGPRVELQAHVALVPMVRVGLYLAGDLAPLGDQWRSYSSGGIHLRASPPLLPIGWRTWAFAGFGYALGYDGGAHDSGGFFEVPAGLGLGRKLSRPLLLFVEAGARVGFAFQGAMYRPTPAVAVENAGLSLGHDAVALTLSVGLSLDD